ncbi:MAG: glycosyltransferase family 2 protein [Prevotella sp.]|nr:glycosyltransferase family 2 protein [Prevotella sp.]
MKRIAVFCVTFKSDQELEHYRASLLKAAEKAGDEIKLDIFVSHNTETDNPGYFGGVKRVMKAVDVEAYDYSIISNVDLTVEEDFLTRLAAYDCDEETGWIAPQIWSGKEGRDRNPKILKRYSLRRLKILRAFFQMPPIWALYHKVAYRKKRLEKHPAGPIYGGHGSFIILTKKYFKRCGKIDYPMFLFCEEIWLAEQCLKSGLRVMYVPDLKVSDAEHASTGRMHLGNYCHLNYEAIQYIISHYY